MSAVFEPTSAYCCTGSLAFADASRHAPHCRPGLWKICAILDSELASLLGTAHLHWIDAVIDDFGNLVPVPAPRRFAVTIRSASGSVETYMRQGGHAIDHSIEAMDRAGLDAKVKVHEVRGAA